jgi:hypothetical protein
MHKYYTAVLLVSCRCSGYGIERLNKSVKKGLFLSGMRPINTILGEDVFGPGGLPWRHPGPALRRHPTDVSKGYSALADAELSAAAMVEGQAERVLVAERRARANERVTFG